MKPIISVRNLSKKYIIGESVHGRGARTFRDIFDYKMRNLFRRDGKPSKEDTTFWALKDVTFDVAPGEVVGIIGRNGAGKSTLLKILSRITEPTTGEINLRGRVASLLEVGTGFSGELTGRENIFLNGSILGMKKKEIKQKFDDIVAFAEVEKFLDTPVKRYSSGMYVRLAFAVAAHLESEILLVDEVLAVGDAAFQQKCMGKMGDVATEGRTVLFVSHNMGAIHMLCPKSIMLQDGGLAMFQDSGNVIGEYLSNSRNEQDGHIKLAPTKSDAFFTAISIHNLSGEICTQIDVSLSFTISFEYRILRPIKGLEVSFSLFNLYGSKVFYCPQSNSLNNTGSQYLPGVYVGTVKIPGNFLAPGNYTINAGIHQPNIQLFDARQHVIGFQIAETGSKHYGFAGADIGSVLVDFPWQVRRCRIM